MAAVNFTEGENQENFPDVYCAAVFTRGMTKEWTFLAILNIILSVIAFLGNALILVPLHRDTALHPPSKLLLRCLPTTDLFVGLISEPISVAALMSIPKKGWNICRYAVSFSVKASYIFCSVSLVTLTAISVDRLFALLLKLRYKQVVTLRRTFVIVIVIWAVFIANAAISFWNYRITAWCGYIITLLCVITSSVSYTVIALTLRHHQVQVLSITNNVHQDQASQASPLNITRYKMVVSSALWLQLALFVCYLLFNIVDTFRTKGNQSPTTFLIREFTLVLIYLNSSLTPILYCLKIREIRKAVKDATRKLFCWLS